MKQYSHVFLAIVVLIVAAPVNGQYNANLCLIAWRDSWSTKWGLAAMRHHELAHSRATKWTYDVIGMPDTANVQAIASVFTPSRTENCDFIIGPGYSEGSMLVLPMLQAPLVEVGATSVMLSDRTRYPYFSRTVPNDAVLLAQVDRLMSELGWKSILIVATTESYGDSIVSQLSALMRERGGVIEQVVDMPIDPSESDWEVLLDAVRRSNTRIVVAAFVVVSDFVRRFRMASLHETHIVVHTEVSDAQLNLLPGSLHLTPIINSTTMYSFYVFATTKVSAAEYAAATSKSGYEDAPLEDFDPDHLFYHAALYEAVRLVMSTVDDNVFHGTYPAVRDASVTSMTERVSLLRQQRLPATAAFFAGETLGAMGEPRTMVVMATNVGPAASIRDVGTLRNGVLSLNLDTPMFLLGREWKDGQLPDDGDKGDAASDNGLTDEERLLATGVPILAAIAIVSLAVIYGLHRTDANRHAPRSETKPLYVAKTKIYRASLLWELFPNEMPRIVELHNDIIRDLIQRHCGYEIVSSRAEEFLVVFKSPDDALDFAAAVQLRLLREDWGTDVLDRYYRSIDVKRSLVQTPPTPVVTTIAPNAMPPQTSRNVDAGIGDDYATLWNGPRECVAIAVGFMSIGRDAESGRYEYLGAVVDEVNEMAEATKGGQITITEIVVDHLNRGHRVDVKPIGSVRIEGNEVRAFQAIPFELEGRKFAGNVKIGIERNDTWDVELDLDASTPSLAASGADFNLTNNQLGRSSGSLFGGQS